MSAHSFRSNLLDKSQYSIICVFVVGVSLCGVPSKKKKANYLSYIISRTINIKCLVDGGEIILMLARGKRSSWKAVNWFSLSLSAELFAGTILMMEIEAHTS